MHVRISTLTQSGVICSSVLIKAQELQACFQCRQGDKNMIQIQSSALQRFTQHSAQISIYLQLSLYITDSVSGSSTHDFDHPAVHFGRSGSLCRLIQHKGFTSIKIQDKKESEGDKRGLSNVTPNKSASVNPLNKLIETLRSGQPQFLHCLRAPKECATGKRALKRKKCSLLKKASRPTC